LTNYEFNKWSGIEIEFLGKNYFSDLLYLSIHSSQSIFKTTFFYPINFGADSEEKLVYSFKFSKSSVRILEWPHETNCLKDKFIYESNGKTIYSFQNCINSCILSKIYEKNKCIQKEGILGLDIELNEKTKNLKICENLTQSSTIIKIEKLCSRQCNQNCINQYIDVYLQQKKQNSNKTISIQSANTPIFVYELHPKHSFTNYASNIGSIISMWFSFAVIDVHKVIKKIITFFIYISRKINSKLNIENYLKYVSIIIEALVLFNKYFMKCLLKLKKVNWNLLSKMICLSCFTYQSIELIMNYLEFETEVVVNLRNYKINGSLESSPGISFCKEKILLNSEKVILLKSSKGGADLELYFNN
jgi:hypothetical protein